MPSHDRSPPYADIVGALVRCVMQSQADLLEHSHEYGGVDKVPDGIVNRRFAWLTQLYPLGINRHLFEAVAENNPIRKKLLRERRNIPAQIVALLRDFQPIPYLKSENEELLAIAKKHDIVQEKPTRISRLIKNSFQLASDAKRSSANPDGRIAKSGGISRKSATYEYIPSPLSIVFDFLTVPENTGSRSFSLLAIRNHLFNAFEVAPDNIADIKQGATFSVKNVEDALSHVWTSLRPRYWSLGEDKLPPEGRLPVDGLIRHYLALKGMLLFRFESKADCLGYLRAESIRPIRSAATNPGGASKRRQREFEYSRSPYLDRLPELGEIVNELWGAPIAIRGADTLFRGGLKFSTRRGLVLALHGGPGSGKTSLALAIGAQLASIGAETLFLTAEELAEDLQMRVEDIVPDEYRRLSFFPKSHEQWLTINYFKFIPQQADRILDGLENSLVALKSQLEAEPPHDDSFRIPKPCRAVIVLDGIHGLFSALSSTRSDDGAAGQLIRLRSFIEKCRDLRALVVLTTGVDWAGDAALDYQVDVAIRLTHEAASEYGKKPDRRLLLSKARNQLCAVGTHTFQLAGTKGVRLSPQINYQLDRRAMWKSRLPDTDVVKGVFKSAWNFSDKGQLVAGDDTKLPPGATFGACNGGINIYRGSNIFLNGRGSGGKAALALKIALSPSYSGSKATSMIEAREKILVVSFLYPETYYRNIFKLLLIRRQQEYGIPQTAFRPQHKVIHLYPGYLMPNDLFNKIEWELDAAEMHGVPYTSIVIDGIHNVFLQFPEIEKYSLLWAQLYSSLRSRPITIITTHTTLMVPHADGDSEYNVDDRRSEPLRHALVQKTDFQFEIDPAGCCRSSKNDECKQMKNTFRIKTLSAINQQMPSEGLYWSREMQVLFNHECVEQCSE